MSTINSEWKTVRIGDLGKVVTGGTPSSRKPEFFGDQYPFITPTDIDDALRYIKTDRFLSEEGRLNQIRKQLPADTVCFVCIGATIGKMCMTDSPSFTNQQINSVVVDFEKHDSCFVYYLLSTLKNRIKGIAAGAATPIVNKSSFSSVEVLTPSRDTQMRIATILSAYDDLIENNRRRIKILEEMAQNLYREWFVKFRFPGHESVPMVDSPLGKIPEGWRNRTFGQVFDIKYGRTLPKKKISDVGPYPVYGAGNIIGYYNQSVVSEKVALVTCRGNGSGTVWRTRQAAFVTNNSLMLIPRPEFKSLTYFFNEQLALHSNIKRVVSGSAQPQITIDGLSRIKTIVPNETIVEKYCLLTLPLYELIDSLIAQNQTLHQTRDLLLSKLISGELDVSELNIATGQEAA